MRILHVTDAYLPKAGGIETQVSELAARQRAEGHQVTVLTRAPGPTDGGPEGVTVLRAGRGLSPWHWLPTARRINAAVTAAAKAAAGDADGGDSADGEVAANAEVAAHAEVDVVHCHLSVLSPAALIGLRAATRAGIPTVATYHSVLPSRPGRLLPLRALPFDRDAVAWTAVSSVAAASVKRLVGPRQPVGLLPNGLDVDRWGGAPSRLRRNPDEVTVVWVGRLTARKRPSAALAVLAAARARLAVSGNGVRLRLVVVGDGPARAAVQARARRLGLADDVRWTGACDRAGVRRELDRADLFLGTATAESFGIAAMEARAAGLPVLTLAGTGTAELLCDGVDGVVAADDRELGEQLARLAADPERLERMRRYARSTPPPVSWERSCGAAQASYRRAAEIARQRRTAALPTRLAARAPAPAWSRLLRPAVPLMRVLVPAGIAVSLLAWALPRAIGTTWNGIGAALSAIHPVWLPVALAVWLVGLWVQTKVQRAALPELTTGRALLLNATGSAVSNVAPFGGALGIAANQRMVRHWGIDSPRYAAYAVVVNLVQLIQKLLLPMVVLAVALLADIAPGSLVDLSVLGAVGLVGLAALSTERTAAAVDRRLLPLSARIARWRHRSAPTTTAGPLLRLRQQCVEVVRPGWSQMAAATVLYAGTHAVGLWLALHAVGAPTGVVPVLAALAVERSASLLLFTPAGAGVAEVAAAAVLVRLGCPPALAAAGLLLHRLIIVGLEVPLGALLGAAWWLRVRDHELPTELEPDDPRLVHTDRDDITADRDDMTVDSAARSTLGNAARSA